MRVGGMWLAAALFLATPASAQIIQSLHVGGGLFNPRGYDGRSDGDVLVADLDGEFALAFRVADFRSGQVFGEWNVGLGRHVEFGAGLGYYGRRVPSVYAGWTDIDGTEIEQDLRLRVVPISGVVRFLPFGRPGTFQPYLGVGVAALNWRYSEAGEFLDGGDLSIFRARYVASGTAPGALVLGGFRLPINGDIYGLTFEWRYQFGTGDLPSDVDFLSDRIDLSGGNLNFGFLVRF
jgi:hypothetical protein